MNIKTITLENLAEATAQEVFDHVALHLLTQGERALDSKGDCRYRTTAGLKCAAGCLMTDTDYKIRLHCHEGWTWQGMVDDGVVPDAHRGLISRLQYLHDSHRPIMWPEHLRKLAGSLRLNTSVIDSHEGAPHE